MGAWIVWMVLLKPSEEVMEEQAGRVLMMAEEEEEVVVEEQAPLRKVCEMPLAVGEVSMLPVEVEGLVVELRQGRIALGELKPKMPVLMRVSVEAFAGLKLKDLLGKAVKTPQILVLVGEQEVSVLSVAWGLLLVVVVVLSFGTSLDRRYMMSLDLPPYQSHRLVSSV